MRLWGELFKISIKIQVLNFRLHLVTGEFLILSFSFLASKWTFAYPTGKGISLNAQIENY